MDLKHSKLSNNSEKHNFELIKNKNSNAKTLNKLELKTHRKSLTNVDFQSIDSSASETLDDKSNTLMISTSKKLIHKKEAVPTKNNSDHRINKIYKGSKTNRDKYFSLKVFTENDIPISKNDLEDELKDRKIERQNDENKVKSLEFWERNLQEKIKKSLKEVEESNLEKNSKRRKGVMVSKNTNSKTENDVLKVQELDTINQKAKIKQSLDQLHSKKFSSYLRDFYKKIDQEHDSILLQNISLSKRSFDFEAFKKNKNEMKLRSSLNKIEEEKLNEMKQIGSNLSIEIQSPTEENNSIPEDDKYCKNKNIKIDDPFLRIIDLKLDENYDKLTSQEFYRSTVIEKIRVETLFRKEMMKLAKNIHEKKIEKNFIINKNSKLSNKINLARENYNLRRVAFELWIKETDRANHRKMAGKNIITNITNNDSFNNAFEFNTNFTAQKVIKEKEIEEIKSEYLAINNKFADSISNNIKYLKEVEEEIRTKKLRLNNLIKDQSNYYLDILKKGIDCRGEGLCWIFRRLIELDAHFDSYSFPRFLEQNQIEFIITLSHKQIDLIELKIILKIMKNKKNKMRADRDIFRRTANSINSNRSCSVFSNNIINALSSKTDASIKPSEIKTNSKNSTQTLVKPKLTQNFNSFSENSSKPTSMASMVLNRILKKTNVNNKNNLEESIEEINVNNFLI